jgi:hypothetical protein
VSLTKKSSNRFLCLCISPGRQRLKGFAEKAQNKVVTESFVKNKIIQELAV